MIESNQHRSRSEQLDAMLSDTFGATQLSESQRLRLQAIAERSRPSQSPAPRVGARPLSRPLALLVIIVLAVAAVWWSDVVPLDSRVDVSAAQRLLAPPAPGEGRHIAAEVHRRYSRDGGDRQWVNEMWQRTLADGTRQLVVEASDISGAQLGRYLQTGDEWYLEYRGSIQSGTGEPSWLPEEVSPFWRSIEDVDAALATHDPEQIEVWNDGSRQIIRVDLSEDSKDGLAQVESDLNEPIEAFLWEIEIDTNLDRVLDTRLVAVGASGAELILSHYTMSTWEQPRAADMDNARFAPPEDESDPGLALRIPEPGSLPSGLIVVSHHREDSTNDGWFSERAVFTGNAGLTVDLSVTPKLPGSERTVRYPEGTRVHAAETSVGPLEWAERTGSGSVEQAIWEDQAHFYYLSVQTTSTTAASDWDVTDLVAFVEALAAAQSVD